MLKSHYIRLSPAETLRTKAPNTQIYINIPREASAISFLSSYLDSNFEDIQKANDSRYEKDYDIKSVNFGPIASFSNFKLTSSGGKHFEIFGHAHIVFLMCKLITSSGNSVDSSIGFDRNPGRRQEDLTNNKKLKGKYHVRINHKDVFGFAKHQ